MRLLLTFLLLSVGVATSQQAAAPQPSDQTPDPQWTRLVTPDFELYTDAGEQKGEVALDYFEQVRSFFASASPVKPLNDNPVRIILFRNQQEFASFAPGAQVAAYFIGSDRRDFIVMADGSPDAYPMAIHEYMHLIVMHSGLHVPVWLNEGWSEVYSTLRPVRDGVAVGDLLPGRMKTLEQGKWLTLEELGAITPASAIYNERDRAGIFYAESWALAHMLFLSPEYKEGFGPLLIALHQGKTLPEALQQTYQRSPDTVFADLRTYFDRKKIFGAVFKVSMAKSHAPAAVSSISADGAKLVQTDLLIALDKLPEAAAAIDALKTAQPGRTDIFESLGYLEMRKKNTAAARDHFEKAFLAGAADAKTCMLLGVLDQQLGQPPAKALEALQRAVQLKPAYVDAQVQLGLAHVVLRQFPAALETLRGIRQIKPEFAPAVFSGLAYSALQTGDVEQARKYVVTARKWMRTPQEKSGVEQLAGFIEARGTGPLAPRLNEEIRQLRGTAVEIVCSPPGARLVVDSGGARSAFLIPPPAAVEFSSARGGSFQLGCGPQKPFAVSIEYAVLPSVTKDAAGILRRLEF